MKEKPILFSESMVLSIIGSTKRVTRRPVKCPKGMTEERFNEACEWMRANGKTSVAERGPCDGLKTWIVCPFGEPGDRLWVREAHGFDLCDKPVYRAGRIGPGPANDKWTPSIHMPRSACRLTLRVESVSIERLMDIDEAGAKAEGFDSMTGFQCAWERMYGDGSTYLNPWVWVVRFTREG